MRKLGNFSDNRAAYSVSLSHIVGDGWTYYALVDQLDCLVNRKPLEPLVWDDPGVSLEINHWSERDKFRSSKLMIPAFICRMLYYSLTGGKPFQLIEVTGSDAMAELKKASRGTAAFVSTNDVVSAALCEIYGEKLVLTPCNMRGGNICSGLNPRIGGNFVRDVIYPRALAAGAPAFIRKNVVRPPFVFLSRHFSSRHTSQFGGVAVLGLSPIMPVRTFGIFAAMVVVCNYVMVLTLILTCMILCEGFQTWLPRAKKATEGKSTGSTCGLPSRKLALLKITTFQSGCRACQVSTANWHNPGIESLPLSQKPHRILVESLSIPKTLGNLKFI